MNSYRFFIVKISVPKNFMNLQLKILSEMCQKIVSLDLRTALMALERWDIIQRDTT